MSVRIKDRADRAQCLISLILCTLVGPGTTYEMKVYLPEHG